MGKRSIEDSSITGFHVFDLIYLDTIKPDVLKR
jgi:hypothetical protein